MSHFLLSDRHAQDLNVCVATISIQYKFNDTSHVHEILSLPIPAHSEIQLAGTLADLNYPLNCLFYSRVQTITFYVSVLYQTFNPTFQINIFPRTGHDIVLTSHALQFKTHLPHRDQLFTVEQRNIIHKRPSIHGTKTMWIPTVLKWQERDQY